ncbi:MAG: 2,3-bisphosphoglycerate-independent phosphoglycerate mutase [Halobacteria archaeon]|nr:2,3-bisphosphoglycerate-independent phosphoglycerate mutase [Halobacteria archaeon]
MTHAALIILDGWGIRDETQGNAVANAETPNFDRWRREGRFGLLTTHGPSVGLTEGQMGNSEVGHLNIGAGRIVRQPIKRIDESIDDGSFFENEALVDAVESGDRLHLMGLVSDGGVHSAQRHLHTLLEMAQDHRREAVVHAFLDGRDTPPKSALGYIEELEEKADETDATVATVSGRYYAMDRDERWERTGMAYDAIVSREGRDAETASEAVEEAYDRGETDEFVEPTVVDGAPALEDGDSVVFFNFRADRARQLTRMLNGIDSDAWDTREYPSLDLDFTTMTEYDSEYGLDVAFDPVEPENVLGEVVSDEGMTQMRIAETEKYAHVTYFLNGGREETFDGEERVIVPSPDVETYDETPRMSAREVTDKALEAVGEYDLLILNYANPDMVGHTGDYEAAVEACEFVDMCAGELVDALVEDGAEVIVTADHGNADEMGTPDDPHTAHTFNPAPFIQIDGDGEVERRGELRDIAPSLLKLLGTEAPDEMTGDPLV